MPGTTTRLRRRRSASARNPRGGARTAQPRLPFPGSEPADRPPVRRGEEPPWRRRHLARLLFSLLTAILIANALIGDRGLPETLRLRREHRELAAAIEALRETNQRLAREADRLRSDPAAIEELARRNLGLVRPDERLFIVTDRRPAADEPRQARREAAPNDAQAGGLLAAE